MWVHISFMCSKDHIQDFTLAAENMTHLAGQSDRGERKTKLWEYGFGDTWMTYVS